MNVVIGALCLAAAMLVQAVLNGLFARRHGETRTDAVVDCVLFVSYYFLLPPALILALAYLALFIRSWVLSA